MPLPISRTRLDKLGQRLATETGSPDDLLLLEEVLAAYDEVISRTLEIIEPLGLRPTSRLKTSGTLVEKLQRERGMMLKGVQDIAGLRIVLSRDQDQDEVVAHLVAELKAATGVDVRVHDRRENPSWGYRAVHLVAKIDNLPVEIQVRTFLQDQWAQLFESLADRWGRQIRYGGEPKRNSGAVSAFRHELIEMMRGPQSNLIAAAGALMHRTFLLRSRAKGLDPLHPGFDELIAGFEELETDQAARIHQIAQMLDEMGKIADRLGEVPR